MPVSALSCQLARMQKVRRAERRPRIGTDVREYPVRSGACRGHGWTKQSSGPVGGGPAWRNFSSSSRSGRESRSTSPYRLAAEK